MKKSCLVFSLLLLILHTTTCLEDPPVSDPSVSDSTVSESETSEPAPVSASKNATAKNFTIDWEEVEKRWHATISEEEVGKKWAEMETGLKNGVRSLLRTIFPQIVSMSSDAKVSGNCSAGILKWIISLRHLKGWAVKSESIKRLPLVPYALFADRVLLFAPKTESAVFVMISLLRKRRCNLFLMSTIPVDARYKKDRDKNR